MRLARIVARYLRASQPTMFPAKWLESSALEYQAGWWGGFDPTSDEARVWAEKVHLHEPIFVNVADDGTVMFNDGHHRAMAGKIRDKLVPIIIQRNDLRPEVWDWYYKLLLDGKTPRQINPEHGPLQRAYDDAHEIKMLRRDLGPLDPNKEAGKQIAEMLRRHGFPPADYDSATRRETDGFTYRQIRDGGRFIRVELIGSAQRDLHKYEAFFRSVRMPFESTTIEGGQKAIVVNVELDSIGFPIAEAPPTDAERDAMR